MTRISEVLLNFLINATWQILAIALLASICAWLLKNASASYRHILWVTALLLSVALPVWSISSVKTESAHPSAPGMAEQTFVGKNAANSGFGPSDASPVMSTPAIQRPPSALRLIQNRSQQLSATPALLLTLSFGYVLFLIYRFERLWRFWRRTEKLKRSIHHKEIPPRFEAVAQQCRTAIGLRELPPLGFAMTAAPGVVGGRRPVIVLPDNFLEEISDETLRSVLGHEMAHVARHDFQTNIVWEFLLVPISFHPLSRFIKQQIDRTRELACDEMVTEKLLEPITHARSLLSIAGALISPADRALTLGIFNANILEERIMTLTQKTPRLGLRAGRLLMLTAVSMLCISCLAISTFSFELRSERRNLADSQVSNGDVWTPTGRGLPLKKENQITLQDQRRPVAARAEVQNSDDAQMRAQAACDAGRGQLFEAIPQLIAMLEDDRKIEPIKCWTNGPWSPALSTFKHPSPGEQAAIALASLGAPALDLLTRALTDSNTTVRRNAAWAIGELTNMPPGARDEAVVPLMSLLSDSDAWVRIAAARALGEMKDERAGERLNAGLLDSDGRVRQISAWALGEMKDERAVHALCNVLIADTQIEVRLAAAEALGEIRDQQAVPSLTHALNDSEPRVRAKVRWAIHEIEGSDG